MCIRDRFRANKENALINRMGFNNPGALAVRDSLVERKSKGLWPNNPIAANIGRSKKVSNDDAPADYSATLDILWDYSDLFVLNISSPNTPGLRELQEEDHLSKVLDNISAHIAAIVIGLPLIEPELSINKVTIVSLKSKSFSFLNERELYGSIIILGNFELSSKPSSKSNSHALFCFASSCL